MNSVSAWIETLFMPRAQRRVRQSFLRRRADAVRKMRDDSWGKVERECPICAYKGMFAPHGSPPRLNAACPSCGSLERHRQIHLYCELEKPFAKDHTVLHFAPEKHLSPYIAARVANYQTADLRDDPMLTHPRLNIEDTKLADNAYDWIVCNHVLEHVNDAKALAEFYRMLKPGGRALITVPVAEGMPKTFEDPTIVSPEARTLHYHQWDHVRYFAHDVRDRIRAPGFDLYEFTADWRDVAPHAIAFSTAVFIATKPAAQA
jgi:SAM-dependent methyltransferase